MSWRVLFCPLGSGLAPLVYRLKHQKLGFIILVFCHTLVLFIYERSLSKENRVIVWVLVGKFQIPKAQNYQGKHDFVKWKLG